MGYLLVQLAQKYEKISPGTQELNDALYVWNYLVWTNQRELLARDPAWRSHSQDGHDTFDFALNWWKPDVALVARASGFGRQRMKKSSALIEVAQTLKAHCDSGGSSESCLPLRQMLIDEAAETEFVYIWQRAQPIPDIPHGAMLRIEVNQPAIVEWDVKEGAELAPQRVFTHDAGHNIHAVDLPTNSCPVASTIRFRFCWREPVVQALKDDWGEYTSVKVLPRRAS